MDIWVVASDDAQLAGDLRKHLATSGAKVKLSPAGSHDEAVMAIIDLEVHRLVVSAQSSTFDCLDLVCESLGIRPQLEVVVCSANREVTLGPTSLETGVCVVHDAADAVAVVSPGGYVGAVDAGDLPRRPDIVDVVRIVAHAGQSRALKVSSSQGSGQLGFVNGGPVFAVAGNLRGNDAFLQMVLWEESRFVSVAQGRAGAGEANISAPVEELLQEAVGLRIAIEGDPRAAAVAHDVSHAAKLLRWWARATENGRSIVRVLVSFEADSDCGCVQSFTEGISSELNPVKQWSSEPEDGPSFVRVHTREGGILSLTFVPMAAKNRFYFDTFCRKSDVVVICRTVQDGEIAGWRSSVPDFVSCVECSNGASHDKGICPAVRCLVERDR